MTWHVTATSKQWIPPVASHHFSEILGKTKNIKEVYFNCLAWKGRSSTNICTAMIHWSANLSEVHWVYWAASAAGFSGQMTANLVNDAAVSIWVVDAGPIFALRSTMNMARAWSAFMLSLILCHGRLHNFTCEHAGWLNQATGKKTIFKVCNYCMQWSVYIHISAYANPATMRLLHILPIMPPSNFITAQSP